MFCFCLFHFFKVDAKQVRWHARITNVSLRRNAATEETTAGMVQMSSTVEEVGFLFSFSVSFSDP